MENTVSPFLFERRTMKDSERLEELMVKKGFTVRRLAKESGVPPTTLYSIMERDTEIRLDVALRLAKALGVDVKEISSDKILKEVKIEFI